MNKKEIILWIVGLTSAVVGNILGFGYELAGWWFGLLGFGALLIIIAEVMRYRREHLFL